MARPAEVAGWILRVLWVTLNNLYAVPASLVWLVILSPIHLLSPLLYSQIEEVFFSWMLSMVACWNWSAGYHVAESGVDLDLLKKSNLLIMPNHQSTADVPLLMTVFSARVGFCNKVMWIMDRVFKLTNFGVISWMHDDFFILAGKDNRAGSLVKLRDHLTKVFLPKRRKYLVLFPEGGFLHNRKEISQMYAKKMDLPALEHCTLPRTGALDVIMSTLGPWRLQEAERGESKEEEEVKVEAKEELKEDTEEEEVKEDTEEDGFLHNVLDVTVAYPEGRPLDLLSIVTGWRPSCTTHVHYRLFPARDLPKTSEGLFAWMVKLYQEKEEMLNKFYQTGKFPYDHFDPSALPPKEICHDPLRFVVIHTFFLFSNYLFYTLAITVGLL